MKTPGTLPRSESQTTFLFNAYPLFAQPDRGGFFGLTELRRYSQTVVDPYLASEGDVGFILDFSLVKIWDIAAVLWLVIALNYYRRNGLQFWLRLPEAGSEMDEAEARAIGRSADYLRRWRFDLALQNLDPEPANLLIPSQRDYFKRVQEYYLPAEVETPKGLVESLISRRLIGIRNLVDIFSIEPTQVSDKLIANCITNFQSARMGDILHLQCGIPKRDADLFSDHLLTEGLMNVKDHPNATMGMVAVSVMGSTNELILAIADNGESIPSTIFGVFRDKHGQAEPELHAIDPFDRTKLSDAQVSKVTDFATQPLVSSKGFTGEDVGMGLTYLKQDTLSTFHGKLKILTESLLLEYKGDPQAEPSFEKWPHSWSGNLLRIAIPLKRDDRRR
jgi:hypothetical protein